MNNKQREKLEKEICKYVKLERNKLFDNIERVYLSQEHISGKNFKPEKYLKYIYNISKVFEKNNISNNVDIVNKKTYYNTKFLEKTIDYKPVGIERKQQRKIKKKYLKLERKRKKREIIK